MKYLLISDIHLKPKHKFSDMVEGKVWDRICQEKLKVLNRIPAIADKFKADVVLWGGDIFDNSNPPEALKAELCNILNKFNQKVVMIPGKPGDHDFVSSNNFVLMDLRAAYEDNKNITIHNDYKIEIQKGVLLCHVMLEGISDLYKNTVKLSDPMFKDYKTILLGDYHAFYKKTYAGKQFVYPSPPYPTRYGESQGGIVLGEVDSNGKTITMKRMKLKSYSLEEVYSVNQKISAEVPTVLKYKLEVPNSEMSKTLFEMNSLKKKLKKNKNILDVIWSIKSIKVSDEEDIEQGDRTLEEVCFEHINNSCDHPKEVTKIFKEYEAKL